MLPILFKIGPFALYTFGIFLFLAFFSALFVVWKRGKEVHFEEEALFDVVFYVLFWLFLGSRIGYVLLQFQDFGFNPLLWLNFFGKPGFWYVSGLIAAIGALLYKAKQQKWDIYTLSDVLVVGLTLAHVIIALGSFFNGNGYGIATDSFLGLRFPGLYDKRLPLQLYEAVFYALLFSWLWRLESRYRTFVWYKGGKSEANSGFITAMYCIFEGIFQLSLTFLRPPLIALAGIRLDWMPYFALLVFGIYLLVKRSHVKPSGMVTYFMKEWGLSGSLLEKQTRQKTS